MTIAFGDEGVSESGPGGAHVDLAAEAQVRRTAIGVEIENHTLALAQHAKHRTDQGIGGEVVVGEVTVAHDDAVSRRRVVGLDYSLHGVEGSRSSPAQPALTILPDLMQPVQTLTRLGEPLTRARTRWMFGFQRRFVRRCEWDTLMPHDGPLPQTSQTDAISNSAP